MNVKAKQGIFVPHFNLTFKAGEVKSVDDWTANQLLKSPLFELVDEDEAVTVKTPPKASASFNKEEMERLKNRKKKVSEE